MANAGAAKAKYPPADATVTVTGGYPSPDPVEVNTDGTVQFVNSDNSDYRVRLWTREHDKHADVDILLPARGGTTVIVDPDTKLQGECRYELLPTLLLKAIAAKIAAPVAKASRTAGKAAATAKGTTAAKITGGGSGGGTIKIGSH
jgi:hypothetical protein